MALFKPMATPPRSIAVLEENLEPFYIVSGYGLFRQMTTDLRDRVQASADGARTGKRILSSGNRAT